MQIDFKKTIKDLEEIPVLILDFVKKVFIWIIFSICVFLIIGLAVWLLYRIATYSKTIYAFVFLSVFLITVSYFVYRAIKEKRVLAFFKKLAKFFLLLLFVLVIIGVFMVYGGFIIRHPVIGCIGLPFLVFIVFFLVRKMKISNFFYKYFT